MALSVLWVCFLWVVFCGDVECFVCVCVVFWCSVSCGGGVFVGVLSVGFDQTFADAADYPDPNSAFKIFRSLVGHLRGLVQTRATRK